jgi:hypothetical protein
MTMTLSRTAPWLASLVIGALLHGCASGPQIRADANPEADFSQYRTFDFFDPLATDKAGYSSILTARLKQAVRRELEARGYVYTDSNPDLLVNFYVNTQEKQYVSSTPSPSPYFGYRAGYYDPWYGWGAMYSTPDVQTYYRTEGTLTIDLVDATKRQLAWQGSASGTVDDKVRQNPGAAVDSAVAQIFDRYTYSAGR